MADRESQTIPPTRQPTDLETKQSHQSPFEKGSEGFEGGLSAENYIALTNTSRATATRDLQDLVAKKLLRKTGELKHTRYWLKLSDDRTQKGGDFQLGL